LREKPRFPRDRRTGIDRRAIYTKKFFPFKGEERRGGRERRFENERRIGWDRVTKWSSRPMLYLQYAKWYWNHWR